MVVVPNGEFFAEPVIMESLAGGRSDRSGWVCGGTVGGPAVVEPRIRVLLFLFANDHAWKSVMITDVLLNAYGEPVRLVGVDGTDRTSVLVFQVLPDDAFVCVEDFERNCKLPLLGTLESVVVRPDPGDPKSLDVWGKDVMGAGVGVVFDRYGVYQFAPAS